MKTAGIICEYNPFHAGHAHQIRETRALLGEDCAIVCLMSGDYVQRGAPAILDKRTRAGAAIYGGADLVLELPLTIASGSAGYFADGAAGCMDALGFIDYLSFGTETGDLSLLKKTAAILESPGFEARLSAQLKNGCSYARARTEALKECGADGEILKCPNAALGIEYIRALSRLESHIQPLPIQRDTAFSSASELRTALEQGRGHAELLFPELYAGKPVHTLYGGEKAMLSLLRRLPDESFRNMAFEAEGLWSLVMKACRSENSLDAILSACKSRRFALSRLRRVLLWLFLGLDRSMEGKLPPYLRILAFNDRGRALLHSHADGSKLPLVSGKPEPSTEADFYFAAENIAADLYGLFALADDMEPYGREQAHHPLYIRNHLYNPEKI